MLLMLCQSAGVILDKGDKGARDRGPIPKIRVTVKRNFAHNKKNQTGPALWILDRKALPRQAAWSPLVEEGALNCAINVIRLPTTYIKSPFKKQLIDQIELAENPTLNIVEGGSYTSHFFKGLKSEHTAYYFEDIPIPYTLNSCSPHLEKLPTMVSKGAGLGGAMLCNLSQKSFQTTTGVSSNGGQQQHINFHEEKNNNFFTGALAYDNDNGWDKTPSRYRQLGIKDRVTVVEGVFQAGHQDAEQKLTISSVNQYLQNTYDNLYDNAAVPIEYEHERFFNLFGVSYKYKNWHTFSALHTIKTLHSGQSVQNVVLTAGAHQTKAMQHFGVFTQQINNHKVYRYDIYGGKKMGPFYPSMRIIKTERQILCPFEITTQLAKPIKIICGSAYYLPNEFQLFDPKYGNAHLKTEHNYHCHIVHNWQKSNWTIEQILFANHITDMIDFDQTYKNRGTLNTVGIDQSIGYEGFNRYKIGCAHTYCVLDGSEPILLRPAWKFLIWQRLHLSENCFVDLRANFTGTYLSTDRTDYTKHIKMPGVFLLDVSSTHILNKNWSILCEVKNLTNHQYESPHGYRAKGIEAWIRFVYTA